MGRRRHQWVYRFCRNSQLRTYAHSVGQCRSRRPPKWVCPRGQDWRQKREYQMVQRCHWYLSRKRCTAYRLQDQNKIWFNECHVFLPCSQRKLRLRPISKANKRLKDRVLYNGWQSILWRNCIEFDTNDSFHLDLINFHSIRRLCNLANTSTLEWVCVWDCCCCMN